MNQLLDGGDEADLANKVDQPELPVGSNPAGLYRENCIELPIS